MLTESWVEGKSVEEKDAQPTERPADLWGLSSKIDSRIWVNFTRNGLRLGSRHQEPPHTDVSRNLATVVVRGVLPGLRRRRTGLLPSGPKSSFQMRASFVFHLETKVLESGWRVEKLIAHVAWSPVISFHSLWWFGVQCHLLVLVHCVLNWFLNLWVQLMKNGGKNKSVAFIIFFSIWRLQLSIFSISEICLIELHCLQRLAYISIIFWPQNIFLFCAMTFNFQTNKQTNHTGCLCLRIKLEHNLNLTCLTDNLFQPFNKKNKLTRLQSFLT